MGLSGIHSDTLTFYNQEISDCVKLGKQDWYGGVKRIVEYYPQLDLYKSKSNYHRTTKSIIEI